MQATVVGVDRPRYHEPGRVEGLRILEELRAVVDAPEQRHHLPPLGDQEPCNQNKPIVSPVAVGGVNPEDDLIEPIRV